MTFLNPKSLSKIFNTNKELNLFGKWIRPKNNYAILENLKDNFKIAEIGTSEQNRPIYTVQFGTGEKKILIWTQMHGNESTGTRALYDLLNFIKKDPKNKILTTILSSCTILCIPMLNPDGAEQFTRVNANGIDLNRDAVDKTAKESKLLRKILEDFNPSFCFNLHDQRTIFGVEGTKNPATISFLAPSEEVTRKITQGRKETMNVIIAMNGLLQQIIPNHVGRYTDEFYPTATGDNFQKLGYNCILIESGHYYDDYNREKTREFTFYSLLQGMYHISTQNNFTSYKDYFTIPNNKKMFRDIVNREELNNEVFQYRDFVKNNKLVSILEKEEDVNINSIIGLNELKPKN